MKDNTRYRRFSGGNDLIFTLIVLILLGTVIFLYSQIAFIFKPFIVIISTIIAPAILAIIMYYIFNPLINWLEKHKVQRVWGIIVVCLTIIALITGLIVLIIPAIQQQTISFVRDFPGYVDKLSNSFNQWSSNSIFKTTINKETQWFNAFIRDVPLTIVDNLKTTTESISKVVSTLSGVMTTLVLFPIISFFLLKDDKRFIECTVKIIPPKFRTDFITVLTMIDEQVGTYIKGQLIVSICVGILTYIGFIIIGIQYSVILALVVTVTCIIPFVGPAIAIIPALIIALIDSPFMVIKLLLVWIVVQTLHGNFVAPAIMGKSLKIHPLTIITVLVVMGELLGVVGLILGIPIYAILRVIVLFFFQKLKMRYNKYFGEDAGDYEIQIFDQENKH